jgi:hypothetical protein
MYAPQRVRRGIATVLQAVSAQVEMDLPSSSNQSQARLASRCRCGDVSVQTDVGCADPGAECLNQSRFRCGWSRHRCGNTRPGVGLGVGVSAATDAPLLYLRLSTRMTHTRARTHADARTRMHARMHYARKQTRACARTHAHTLTGQVELFKGTCTSAKETECVLIFEHGAYSQGYQEQPQSTQRVLEGTQMVYEAKRRGRHQGVYGELKGY